MRMFLQKYNHLGPPDMTIFSVVDTIINSVRYFRITSRYNVFELYDLAAHPSLIKALSAGRFIVDTRFFK